MISIVTRYLGPTDRLGHRIRATIPAIGMAGNDKWTVVVPYGDGSTQDCHYRAALAVAAKRQAGMERQFGSAGRLVVLKEPHADIGPGYVFLAGSLEALEWKVEQATEQLKAEMATNGAVGGGE